MAHEFIARKGLIVPSGSILVTSGSVTASNFVGTASAAISSSYALTASYALNSGGGGQTFPFTGDAVITGSLQVVSGGGLGSVTGSFSGSGAGLFDIKASLAIDTYNFIGNGARTEYYLSQSYTENSLVVSVEGITNIVGGDFTLSGPTMSFTVAPPSQSNILVKAFLAASSGSYATYTGSFIGNGSGLTNLPVNFAIKRQVFTGNGATQNYVLSQSYLPSGMVVTVGGLRYIDTNDYTVSGDTIQFVQAPPTNSIIIVDAFINAGTGSVGTFSGSLIGNASTATTASYAANAELLDGKDSTTFATTGSNTFVATQTIAGNLFLSASFPLVYNNSATNNMLFGLFDGSTIHGAYYQVFGNNYASLSQRGGAEFVYDVRNNSDANFHIASFNGSTWTEKFKVDDIGAKVTGSLEVTAGITGSLFGTSSWASNAVTSSFASNVLKTKAGSVANTSFGGTPYSASVTFSTAFSNTNYAVIITGEDARIFTVESKTSSGFTVNTNSNTALTGTTYWTCTAYGEN